MIDQAELLPCPFCGGEAGEFTERDHRIEPLVPGHPIDVFIDNTYFGVRCQKCDVGHTNPYIERENAITAWNTRATPKSSEGEAVDETSPGAVQWHSSEGDGGPDVGILVGLGAGRALWIGEMLDAEGGGMGMCIYGPDKKLATASLSELEEVRDLFSEWVAPAIRNLAKAGATDA